MYNLLHSDQVLKLVWCL